MKRFFALKDYNLLELTSRYRTELMGWGILGVLVWHTTVTYYTLNVGIIGKMIIELFLKSVFTQGFMLLSGFGLYYSFYRNDNLMDYYTKRAKRLLIPYMIIVLPFILISDLYVAKDFGGFFGHLTTLSYWFSGNYRANWYVAASLLMYLLFPAVYKFLFRHDSKRFVFGKFVILMSLYCVIHASIYYFFHSYFMLVCLALDKMPAFFIGVFLGYLSMSKSRQPNVLYVGIALIIVFSLLRLRFHYFYSYLDVAYRLVFIPVFCLFFDKLKDFKSGG